MDFEMSSPDLLDMVALRLRDAGYDDASAGQRREGDPVNVLSVTTEDSAATDRAVEIVADLDPWSRRL